MTLSPVLARLRRVVMSRTTRAELLGRIEYLGARVDQLATRGDVFKAERDAAKAEADKWKSRFEGFRAELRDALTVPLEDL